MKKYESGFTLFELIIAMALAAILVGLGVPSFNTAIDNYQARTNMTRVQSSMVFARSEASKRGTTVSVCRTDNGSTCSDEEDTDWDAGWLIFVDEDGAGDLDAGTDEIIKVVNALSGFTLTSAVDVITYSANGAVTPATFDLCPNSGESDYARGLVLVATGRPRVLTTGVSCGS
ncbi:prepilin-type N-terminal cleavage/methylation domain-containing protein [Pseudomaricurvus alkylphenolicus]|uniref:GspH/FimT family pseudopilin n=1 Tax=Pseudomaricurvus alkylphenolicus TaxID=1306991 RepID=UPI0014241A91|nr:GspH/FimT family pseudopilin [Pseudomaricurvus alkylphenolicus]NIB40246.1 prepilin-type N-terminal cleavage/methylation domain-containing protein [Pseudomaricurvus alkylphenolicus]